MAIVPAATADAHDYQSASAMTFFNKNKKTGSFGFATCKAMAEAILAKVAANDAVEKIELSKIGKGPDDKSGFFLNIFLKDSFIADRINKIALTQGKLEMSNLV